MSDVLVGGILTFLTMVTVAVVTGVLSHRGKKIPEPTPIDKLWLRLDHQDTKIAGLEDEVGTLQRQVVAYRGGFLAFVSWSERVTESWTGPIPLVAFTREEDQAIKRGMDLAQLENLHDRDEP